MNHSTNKERCMQMVGTLNAELGWHLDKEQQHSYTVDLLFYIQDSTTEPGLRLMVTAYHHDHTLVEALRDQDHPDHEAAWSEWCTQAIRILQSRGHNRLGDAQIDIHDLAQIALEELIRALPSFRYASRFSTWAYMVISNSVLRYHRDRNAAKRNGKLESLERRQDLGLGLGAADSPEAQSEAQSLTRLIRAQLDKHGDRRLGKMFHLRVIEEYRLADIAKFMNLSQARVSVLLDQMRDLIRQDDAILAWINDTASPDFQRAKGATD